MRSNVYLRRNEAREERLRQMRGAGLMSERFPGVASIVIQMHYRHERASTILRTLNFIPSTHAFFKFTCLGEGCAQGGLDLTWVIQRMIRSHDTSARGELSCENTDPAIPHANVAYTVSISYA